MAARVVSQSVQIIEKASEKLADVMDQIPGRKDVSSISKRIKKKFDDIPKKALEEMGPANLIRFRDVMERANKEASRSISGIDAYEKQANALRGILYDLDSEIDDQIDNKIQRVIDRIEVIEKEAKEKLDTINEVSKGYAVATSTEHYTEESAAHLARARWSLVALAVQILMIPLIVAYSDDFLFAEIASDEKVNVANYISSKIIIAIVVMISLAFAAKTYTRSMHNFVVNRHRRNALLSYRLLRDSAVSKEANDTILIGASGAIFTAGPTAFGDDKLGADENGRLVGLVNPVLRASL